MPADGSSSMHRKQMILSGTAGVLFSIVAVLDWRWDWRGVLAPVAGVLYLTVSVREYRKVKSATSSSRGEEGGSS